MEKNRRANLRGHLEMLRTVVPSATISSRDTTLALLTRANNHLKVSYYYYYKKKTEIIILITIINK